MAKHSVSPIFGEGLSMKRVIFGIMILAMICIFLNACGQSPEVAMLKQRPDTDVTSSPQYNFQSFAGTVWKTKVKVALADVKRYNGWHEPTLLPPDCFDPAHPEYIPPPGMQQIIAVLPVGTRLRIERLMQDNGEWGGVQVTASLEDAKITASLEDGKVVYVERGLLAKNRFIFPGSSDSKEWGVDPDMLEK
jgi:hypothetical protein